VGLSCRKTGLGEGGKVPGAGSSDSMKAGLQTATLGSLTLSGLELGCGNRNLASESSQEKGPGRVSKSQDWSSLYALCASE
jgi:hypothetical protein